jgi:D-xylose transport system permease protein
MELGQQPPTGTVPELEEAAATEPAAAEIAIAAAPEVVADNLRQYARAWLYRVRSGDSGVLPVIGALLLIVVIFQLKEPKFLSAGNLVDLFNYMVVFALFAMAEVFVLLLGEIDLSIVYNAGIGATLMACFVARPWNLPWWLVILIGIACTTFTGLVIGTLITRLRLPSFIVTLAFFLGLEGVMLWLFGRFTIALGGNVPITNSVLTNLTAGDISSTVSWVAMAILVLAFGTYTVMRNIRLRASGLVTAPMGVALLKVAAVAVAGVVVVAICNVNRGTATFADRGVPWSIPILLAIFAAANALMSRTRFGRYVYAIGGNSEAARRAGINVSLIRTLAFGLTGMMAGFAGMMYLSLVGSISPDIDTSYMLYAVAAAVIGGTSLFGGRGKVLHGILGGLVIAAVYNGLDLWGLGAAYEFMVVAVVLLVAIIVDSFARGVRRVR